MGEEMICHYGHVRVVGVEVQLARGSAEADGEAHVLLLVCV